MRSCGAHRAEPPVDSNTRRCWQKHQGSISLFHIWETTQCTRNRCDQDVAAAPLFKLNFINLTHTHNPACSLHLKQTCLQVSLQGCVWTLRHMLTSLFILNSASILIKAQYSLPAGSCSYKVSSKSCQPLKIKHQLLQAHCLIKINSIWSVTCRRTSDEMWQLLRETRRSPAFSPISCSSWHSSSTAR